jgi:hypothetical protein
MTTIEGVRLMIWFALGAIVGFGLGHYGFGLVKPAGKWVWLQLRRMYHAGA